MLPQAGRSPRTALRAVQAPRCCVPRLWDHSHGHLAIPRVGQSMDTRGRSQDVRVMSHRVECLFIWNHGRT